MAPCRPPSFFKILLDPSAPHLPLPPDFVTKHLVNKIPKDPIIRSANGEYSWRLKIRKIGESYCFSDGWNNVVRDIELTFGDFLIFGLLDQSTFKVLIYSPNGCEKDLPQKIKIEQDSDIVDDDDVVVEDDDEEQQQEEEDNDDEEEEDDDDDDEDDDEDVEEYEEQIEYVDDDDDDEEDEDEDDGGGDIDGDDGDPFFSSIISRTHKSILRLPLEFVRLAGIDGKGTITLKNLDGEECEASVRFEKLYNRYYVSTRWPDFRQSNDLSEGDECVFKFIRSEGTLLLAKVTRKKRRPRDPRPSNETPVTESVRRKRGRPRTDDGVPASEDVKRKKGSPPPRPRRGVPASEDLKRKKGSPPPRPRRGVPASEDVKRKKGSPPPRRPRRGVPASEDLKRRKGVVATEVVKRKKEVVQRRRGRQGGRTRKAQ